jgi:hypothetical protein
MDEARVSLNSSYLAVSLNAVWAKQFDGPPKVTFG